MWGNAGQLQSFPWHPRSCRVGRRRRRYYTKEQRETLFRNKRCRDHLLFNFSVQGPNGTEQTIRIKEKPRFSASQ